MAGEDPLLLGIEIGLLLMTPILFLALGWYAYRWTKRDFVWVEMELRTTKIKMLKVLPKKGLLITKYGTIKIVPGTERIYKNRTLYRGYENYPYPMSYTRDRIPVEIEEEVEVIKNGEKVKEKRRVTEYQEIVKAEPSGPGGYRISTHLKQHIFADIYQNRAGMTLLLIVVVGLLIVSILIQVVK